MLSFLYIKYEKQSLIYKIKNKMFDKIKKTVQKIKTVKMTDIVDSFTTTKNDNDIDSLKFALLGYEKSDDLLDIKQSILIDDNDPFADLKKSILTDVIEETVVEEEVELSDYGVNVDSPPIQYSDYNKLQTEIDYEAYKKEKLEEINEYGFNPHVEYAKYADEIDSEFDYEPFIKEAMETEIVEEPVSKPIFEKKVKKAKIKKINTDFIPKQDNSIDTTDNFEIETLEIKQEEVPVQIKKFYTKISSTKHNKMEIVTFQKMENEFLVLHLNDGNENNHIIKDVIEKPFEIYDFNFNLILDFYENKSEDYFKKDVFVLKDFLLIGENRYNLNTVKFIAIVI